MIAGEALRAWGLAQQQFEPTKVGDRRTRDRVGLIRFVLILELCRQLRRLLPFVWSMSSPLVRANVVVVGSE